MSGSINALTAGLGATSATTTASSTTGSAGLFQNLLSEMQSMLTDMENGISAATSPSQSNATYTQQTAAQAATQQALLSYGNDNSSLLPTLDV